MTVAVAASGELLAALDVAEGRLREGYGTVPTPRLDERFDSARRLLDEIRSSSAAELGLEARDH